MPASGVIEPESTHISNFTGWCLIVTEVVAPVYQASIVSSTFFPVLVILLENLWCHHTGDSCPLIYFLVKSIETRCYEFNITFFSFSTITALKKKVLFWSNYRFIGSSKKKKMYRKALYTLYLASSCLPNCSMVTVWKFISPLSTELKIAPGLRVCIDVCNLVTCVVLCNHHCSQDTELFLHKAPTC